MQSVAMGRTGLRLAVVFRIQQEAACRPASERVEASLPPSGPE